MSDKWRLNESLWWAYFGVGILVGTVLAGFFLIPDVQSVLGDRSLWLGTGGLVSAGVSIFTLVGVFAAGIGVYLNQKNNREVREEGRKIERTQRFQKGAELLSGATLPSQFVGVKILEDLAKSFPAEFRELVINALVSAASHMSSSEYKRTRESVENDGDLSFSSAQSDVEVAPSIIICLSGLAEKTLEVGSIYVDYFTFVDIDMRNIYMINAILYECEFDRVNFSGGGIHFLCDKKIEFTDCDLSLSKIESSQVDTGPIKFTECDLSSANISFKNRALHFTRCKMDGVTISANNVFLEDCWSRRELPNIQIPADKISGGRPIYHTGDDYKFRISERGLRIFVPGRRKPKILTINPL